MMAKTVTALLVDDNADDLKIAERLSRVGLATTAIRATGTADGLREVLETKIAELKPSVVFLDYRLDDAELEDGTRASYRGGTIAAQLKEHHPELPLILLTTETKLHEWLDASPRIKDLFDHLVLKSEVNDAKGRASVAAVASDLGSGYEAVFDAYKRAEGWAAIARAMKANVKETSGLESLTSREAPGRPAEGALWLLRETLNWPGLLVDDANLAARLGLPVDQFSSDAVREWLAKAEYGGAFHVLFKRWWKGRAEKLLATAAGEHVNARSSVRTAAIGASIGTELTHATCAWCNGELVDRACAVCGQAVDQSHCLPASTDDRPPWAERAIVCFRCIARGQAETVAFGAGTDSIVSRVKAGTMSQEPLND
jgi:CheY-like chemotaxis protein